MEAGRYPSELEHEVSLASGSVVRIRPIRPEDAPALVEFHGGLSDRTVYRRFFFDHPKLAAPEVERFTAVDYEDRLALVAEVDGRLIAVARYDRTDTGEAELAFVVADDFQRQGLGTLLFQDLVRAAADRGIGSFVAYTQPGNTEMLGVLTGSGNPTSTALVEGVLVVRGSTIPDGGRRGTTGRSRGSGPR
jgi:GNAT superfamily N-acetyltransferase